MPNKQKIDAKHLQSSEKCKHKLVTIIALLMGTVKKTDNKLGKDMEALETLCTAGW